MPTTTLPHKTRVITPGLKERIKRADSITAIRILLAEGRDYEEAAPNTRRQWEKAADRRTAELSLTK